MSQEKAQLIAPQGHFTVPGLNVAGVVTASSFSGNCTGTASSLAQGSNLVVGVMTASSFAGDVVGNAAGLSTTTAGLKLGIVTATSFAGNFTGIGSGLTGTPNIVAGLVTASQFVGNTPGLAAGLSAGKNLNAGIITATTFHGDGSNLTGAGSTAFIRQDVTAQSGTTTINLNDGNIIYLTHSNNTTIAFSNVSTANDITIIRTLTDNTITWPAGVKWNGGSAPTLVGASDIYVDAGQVFNLTTYNGGTTWYGWEEVNNSVQKEFKLFSWGAGYQGQLGQNTSGSGGTWRMSSPVQVPGTNWNALCDTGGSVLSVGAAVKHDGTLWSWGDQSEGGDNYGVLGLNDQVHRSSPTQIPGTTWVDVQKGYKSMYASKTDGSIWAWGYNISGSLGQNNRTTYSSPVQIGSDTTWAVGDGKLAAGQELAGAIKTDGTLWVWGKGEEGSLGLNQAGSPYRRSSPVQVPGTNWNTIGMNGKVQVLATKTDGTLWGWGGDSAMAQNNMIQYSSPVQIPGTTWTSCGGGETVFATKSDGTLWAWGNMTDYGLLGQGQRGTGGAFNASSPIQIPGTNWKQSARAYTVTELQAGAVKTDGTLWMWGYNVQGNLGQNNTTQYSSPVQIPGTKWVSIASAYNAATYATQEV